MPRKTYRDELLKDSDVRRWYDGLSRNSKITAEERIRILGRFCRMTEWTPKSIVEQVRNDIRARPDKNGTTFEDVFDDFIQAQLDAGRAPSYVQNYRKTMTSWLRHNSLPFFDIRKLNMGDAKATPTIEDESLPSPDQLRGVISRATLRGRAIIALVAFAGLRFEVLGNNEGADGLRLKDLLDFEVREGKVTVKRTPAMVKVRANLSKTRRRYFSFLTSEGTEMVRVYLQDRLDRGEELTQDSPIIRCTPGREFGGRRVNGANYGSPFIVSRNIAREVRRSFGKEIRSRPYVLRSFFNTTLLIARSRAGMPPRDYRTFWMGHVGDIEATYSMNKHPTPEFIEDQRRAFQAAEPYLSTSPEGALNIQERLEREAAEREALETRIVILERLNEALVKMNIKDGRAELLREYPDLREIFELYSETDDVNTGQER